MRANAYFPLIAAAAVSVNCSAAPPALRVGVERDTTRDAETAQDNSSLAAASASRTQLDSPDASAKRLQTLQLSIVDAAMGGQPASTLSVCSGECLDVSAKIQGGNPPYKIAWDDGSTLSERHLCPQADSQLTVSVTDTEIKSVEFAYAAQRQQSSLQVSVRDCAADAGKQQSAAAPGCGATGAPAAATCSIAPGVSLPEEVTVDIPGATARPFAQGAALPAGRYRLEYVDGCNTYGLGCDWTVHASTKQLGLMSCFLVTNGGTALSLTPGTSGIYADDDPDVGGAFKTYAECVAANCKEPPLDFDFAGGTLSVQRDGGGVLGAVDDAGGESMGGRSPTFRLSRLDCN